MSSRALTERGRSGKKWVGLNYKEKERAKEANGGVMPYTLSLVTSDFPHRAEWSEINLPDILFYIQPPVSEYEAAKVEYLTEDGEFVMSDDGRKIRKFEILPRHISLDVPGWLVEAWRRLDSRIGYQDILDRQYADPNLGLQKHTKNALQNHCRRECRKVLNTWVEYGRRDEPHRTEVEAIEGLAYENVQLNTTLKRSEIFGNRLVKVRLERRVKDGLYYAIPHMVNIQNWQETTVPLDHFLPDSQPMEMTHSMHAAWEMYLALMERAAVHGYGHWSKLDRSCLPVTWYDRTTVKSVPNDTYDGGCATCTWSLGRAIPASADGELEQDEVSSTRKTNKRRRSENRAELWDIGDTPKAPKRRHATKLSSKRQDSRVGGGSCDSSPSSESVTFVETYRRDPEEYEYYTVPPNQKVREDGSIDFSDGSEEGFVSNEEASDEESESDAKDEAEEDEGTPSPYFESEPLSPNNEEVIDMISNVGPDDPFTSQSIPRSSRRASYRTGYVAAGDYSSPPRHSSQARAWLRNSNLIGSTSSDQDLNHSPRSSIKDKAFLQPDLEEIPGYLPATSFQTHHALAPARYARGAGSTNLPRETSFTSLTTLPGSSFSSNDTSVSTAASSFTEVSHTAIDRYQPLPTPLTVGFPTADFYPLPMTQSEAAFHSLSYPSPPRTAIYQNEMSFNSSPPRHSELGWGWLLNRARRCSHTGAAGGVPGDFAGIGAFQHELTAISSYLEAQEYIEALDLPEIAHAEEYTISHFVQNGDFENGHAFSQEQGIEDDAVGPIVGGNFDTDFPEEQMDCTTAPLSFLQI